MKRAATGLKKWGYGMFGEIDGGRRVRSSLMGLWLLLCAPAALALGLGGMDVDSALGEPLEARITLLSVTPSERDSLRARLGTRQTYANHGVKRPAIIDDIDVAVQDSTAATGATIVHLTTSQPVARPLLELLVVAQTNDGRSVRKYSALLSPKGMEMSAPASPVAIDQPRGGDSVLVGPEQTLWSIAKRNKYADVSIQQMLIAIYRGNPSAFAGSINDMKVGSTLVMPAHDKVTAIDAGFADNWVDEHS